MSIRQLQDEELNSMKNLLNQYKKELSDLTFNKGISKTMSKPEISSAISTLKSHIKDLENNIRNYRFDD